MHGNPSRLRASGLASAALGLAALLAGTSSSPGAPGRTERPGRWVSPPVDRGALLAEDEARERAGHPPRRGALPLAVDLDPGNAGIWEVTEDGGRRWRLEVSTEGAVWTVLGFDTFRLPPGAALRVATPDGGTVQGPFTAAEVREDGELWLAPIAGDTLVIELDWPSGTRPAREALHLATVSHGYRPWGGIGEGEPLPLGAGDCHVDVACPLGDGWEHQARGVVQLHIGNTGVDCSGTLVNNTDLDCTPYVLTADHCFDTIPAGNPASVTFLFDYALPACEPGSVPMNRTLTGSTLKASHVPTDHRLLQINSSPPPSWNVFFNGWSRSSTPPAQAWTIHHPLGGLEKISHDDDPLVTGISEGPDHWRVNNWEAGSTDPGSSGGPLFDPNRRVIGELHVDTASCANPGGFAEFGRFDLAWSNGLSLFLDPAPATGATTLDGMDQSLCGAPGPLLAHAGHTIDDSQGFPNGYVNPGESFALEVELRNGGPVAATGVSGTLATAHPLVAVQDGTSSWVDVQPYQTVASNAPHFTIDVGPAFECGESIPFVLTATATQGSWPSEFLVHTGLALGSQDPPPFADDMESGVNGWIAQTLIGTTAWAQTTAQSNSPTTSWHVPNVTGVRDSVLLMPTVSSMPPQATLSFAHRMQSETGDGGVLEYTTNGSTWLDAGPWITVGPYNSVIPTSLGSPIGGRTAWAGDLGGWRAVDVDLGALEGHQVTLRWRFASDQVAGGAGWYVDDVVLDAPAFQCASCADLDSDGFCPAPAGSDCDDVNGGVYPGAPQVCDGLNNDCSDLAWPALPPHELDGDGDGHTACAGDCNASDPGVHPGAGESCDGLDNDCDGQVDDSATCDLTCDAAEPAGAAVTVTADPSTSIEPTLVWTGSGYGVAWSDARDGNLELYYSGLGPFGQIGPGEVRLTNASFDSVGASLVWTGSEYGVAWCDLRNGPREVFFARFSAAGVKLTGDLPVGTCLTNQTALAWSGSTYAIAWGDAAGEVRCQLRDASGAALGGSLLLSDGSGNARQPALAWNDTEYGVAFHSRDGGNVFQIYLARVSAAGVEIGSATPVTATPVHSRQPALVRSGSGYGVAWGQGNANARAMHFVRLGPTGSVLGSPIQVSDGSLGSGRPALAWTGGEYGMLWRDTRDGNGEIYFARLATGGAEIGSEMRLSASAADSLPGTLAWTGSEYGVVWSESPTIFFARVGCNCFDTEGDGLVSCNDNCPTAFNPSQADLDADFEGDHCDLDDGLVYLRFSTAMQVDWQTEQGFDAWNLYKGDLDVLRTSGVYTQSPGSNALAARQCGLAAPPAADAVPPAPGQTAFFLASGVSGGVEGGLGSDSTGTPRPNANPCP